MAADDTGGQPAPSSGGGPLSGSLLTKKTGPLANWIWMMIILLVALVYAMWKKNRAAATPDAPAVDDTLDNQTPPPVFILPQNPQPTVPITIVNNPTTPPTAPPSGTGTTPTTPPPKPGPPAKPKADDHWVVTVSKYTTKNPPWNSTVWGIAQHSGYGSASNNWASIWKDPRNAGLVAKRKTPGNIQPGDKIYVKKK